MSTSTTDPNRGWLAVPGPLRSLFKLFPLHVYDPEPLPYRSPDPRPSRPALYVFSLPSSGDRGLDQAPSYNPSCLKWQTFLRIAGVDVDLVPSNNHASPSGALPFLLPASDESQLPLTGDKILGFARRHSSYELPAVPNHRLDAYRALIAQSIRPAWLHALYLHPDNDTLLRSLYLPSSPFLSIPLRQTLHEAATAEILRTTRRPLLLPDHIYADAKTAFDALSTVLGADDWFFGGGADHQPGIFDAEVFAYTWLILDTELAWQTSELRDCLAGFKNLVAHRERLYQRCWPEKVW